MIQSSPARLEVGMVVLCPQSGRDSGSSSCQLTCRCAGMSWEHDYKSLSLGLLLYLFVLLFLLYGNTLRLLAVYTVKFYSFREVLIWGGFSFCLYEASSFFFFFFF